MKSNADALQSAPVSGVEGVGISLPTNDENLLSFAFMGSAVASFDASQGVAEGGSGGVLGSDSGSGVDAVDGDGLNLQV